MKARAWKSRIKRACIEAGVYKPYFEHVISALSGILARRDEVEAAYIEDGAQPVIEFTNKNGSCNMVKNPLLAMWDDLNKTALQYWKELGLTPQALRKIYEDGFKEQTKKASLLDMMTAARGDEKYG